VLAVKLPPSVQRFREDYRTNVIGRSYNGRLHLVTTLTLTGFVVVYMLATLENVKTLEWLTLPLAFTVANFVEYVAHRFPMHRPLPGLKLLYKRHTLSHHHFYTHEAMEAESARDFHMILFPPAVLVFFLILLDAPMALATYALFGANVMRLFVVMTVGYFMSYELLHTIYHLSPQHWAARLPLMQRLRRLHQSHHDLALMGRYNYNITFPMFDWVFGTHK
jgi:hypothetical protein